MNRSPGGLLSNATALLAGRLAIAVMGWAGTVIIVRSLTETGFGQFTLVFSVLGMASIVTELGLGRVAIAGVLDAETDTGSFAGTYVVLRTVLGFVGYALALLFVAVGGYPDVVVKATALAGAVVLIATPSHAYDLAFQAHMRMPLVAAAQVAGQAGQLALTIAIAVAGGGLLWFVIPAVAAEVLIVAIKIRPARRLIDFRYSVRLSVWRALVKEAVPLSIGGALVTLFTRVDAVMLSQLDTFSAVGVYGVASKFADLARFVASALTVPILTLFVTAWPNRLDDFRTAVVKGCMFLGFFGGMIVVQFTLFADDVIELLYGPAFRIGGTATKLLVLGASMNFFTALAFSAMVGAARHRTYPATAFLGLVVNIGLNLWLIPRYSFEGAAVATVITNLLVVLVIWAQLLRLPGLSPLSLSFLGGLFPAMAAAGAAGWATNAFLPWPVAGVVTAAVYVGGVEVVGAAGPDGLRSILSRAGVRMGDKR